MTEHREVGESAAAGPTADGWLWLYPARYRADHGDEIAEVFAETASGLTGRALLRERAALAAHALRLRTGLGSSAPTGRALAAAAPFALAGAAGIGLIFCVLMGAIAITSFGSLSGMAVGPVAAGAADSLPFVGALVLALTGRWTAARLLVLLATAAKLVAASMADSLWPYLPGNSRDELLGTAALGLLVLLAPPDLVDVRGRRQRRVIGAMALLSAPPVVLIGRLVIRTNQANSPLLHMAPLWCTLFPTAAVLAALATRRPDYPRAVGSALAALPWMPVLWVPYDTWSSPEVVASMVCAQLVGAVVLATAIRVVRARLRAQPLEPV